MSGTWFRFVLLFDSDFAYQSLGHHVLRPRADARRRAEPSRPARRARRRSTRWPSSSSAATGRAWTSRASRRASTSTAEHLERALRSRRRPASRATCCCCARARPSASAARRSTRRSTPGSTSARPTGCASRRPKIFGVDSPSPDNPADRIYPVHLFSREHRHHPLREPRRTSRRSSAGGSGSSASRCASAAATARRCAPWRCWTTDATPEERSEHADEGDRHDPPDDDDRLVPQAPVVHEVQPRGRRPPGVVEARGELARLVGRDHRVHQGPGARRTRHRHRRPDALRRLRRRRSARSSGTGTSASAASRRPSCRTRSRPRIEASEDGDLSQAAWMHNWGGTAVTGPGVGQGIPGRLAEMYTAARQADRPAA